MTLFVIAASAAATLATDDPVITIADVGKVRDAVAAVRRAGEVQVMAETRVAAAVEAATNEGRARGHADGLAAAAAETAAAFFAQNLRLGEERRRLRAEVTRLALEVVRRIAGDIGEAAIVAGLAERAAAELLPDAVAVVRVSPGTVDAVSKRLRAFPGLTVVGDVAVAANDCSIENALGVSHAGLEVQLAAVERAWGAAVESVDHG